MTNVTKKPLDFRFRKAHTESMTATTSPLCSCMNERPGFHQAPCGHVAVARIVHKLGQPDEHRFDGVYCSNHVRAMTRFNVHATVVPL